MEKQLTKNVKVHPLMTPSFILVGERKEPMPICDFSYEEIEELCAEFTKDMHRKREKKP